MEIKRLLNKIYKKTESWHGVARELEISYGYLCLLKKGSRNPGFHLLHVIKEKAED
jgi:hypothetical protein